MTELTADAFTERLLALASEEEWAERLRCFKTGAGEYAEHDTFVGVRMGEVFRLAKEFIGTPTNSWLHGIPATQPTMSPGERVVRQTRDLARSHRRATAVSLDVDEIL